MKKKKKHMWKLLFKGTPDKEIVYSSVPDEHTTLNNDTNVLKSMFQNEDWANTLGNYYSVALIRDCLHLKI